LNPDLLQAAAAAHEDDGTFLMLTQIARFTFCMVAIASPTIVISALIPHKTSSRWKLPLRLLIAVVSIGMLTLNGLAWGLRSELRRTPLSRWEPRFKWLQNTSLVGDESMTTTDDVGDEKESEWMTVMTYLSYITLGICWFLLAVMALFFVIFVAFRGAQLQKRREEAEATEDAEDEIAESVNEYMLRYRLRAGIKGKCMCVIMKSETNANSHLTCYAPACNPVFRMATRSRGGKGGERTSDVGRTSRK